MIVFSSTCLFSSTFAAFNGRLHSVPNRGRAPGIIRLAQISDAHVIDTRIDPLEPIHGMLPADSPLILQTAVDEIKDHDVDLTLVTGDLAEGGGHGLDHAGLAARILAEIEKLMITGNHDGFFRKDSFLPTTDGYSKANFYRMFAGDGPDGSIGYWRRDFSKLPISVLGLETSHDGMDEGYVGPEQLRWLRETLREIGHRRSVLVAMHHPLILFHRALRRKENADMLRVSQLNNHQEVEEAFLAAGNVRWVLSGHVHAAVHIFRNGIHYLSSPAAGMWPLAYTLLDFSREGLAFRRVQINLPDLIEKSRRMVFAPGSIWMEHFQNDAAALESYLWPRPHSAFLRNLK